MPLLIPLSSIVGCSSNNDDGGSAFVNELGIEQSSLVLGQESVLTVKFSFSADDVFENEEEVGISVRLPSQLAFKDGSAEIKRIIDDHGVSPAGIASCSDSSSFVSFSFSRSDLIDANNPGGNADAELRFTVTAKSRGTGSQVLALAKENGAAVNCTTDFDSQAALVVTVQ